MLTKNHVKKKLYDVLSYIDSGRKEIIVYMFLFKRSGYLIFNI